VHDGVHLAGGDHLGDDRIPDVRPDEGSLTEIVPWRGDVHPDNGDVLLGCERASESGAEIACDPGDEDNPLSGHQDAGSRYLPARRR